MRRRESVDSDDKYDLCEFCYPSADRSILYEDENVYVMPCLGSFVEGYVLMVSTAHRECVASIADAGFADVKRRIGNALDEVYGRHCFFEHGRVGSCYHQSQNRICFHAHLHCLPIAGDFVERIEADFDSRAIDSVTDLPDVRQELPHYLYVETDDGQRRVFDVDENIERQYLRRRACQSLGLPEKCADWRENPYRERMQKTATVLSGRIDRPTRTDPIERPSGGYSP